MQPKVMMKCRELSFSTRLCALVVVISWTTSLIFCSTECLEGRCDSEGGGVGHKDSNSHANHDDSSHGHYPGGCPNDQTLCSALASTIVPSVLNYTPPPQLITAVFPRFPSSTLASETNPYAEHFRQTIRCDLILTPEVCLGPAFRSLAPPVF